GGTYPIYGNFTDYFDNVQQQWAETDQVTGPSQSDAFYQQVGSIDTATTNVYSGAEELTSPNAALLLSISFVQSQTSQLYDQRTSVGSNGGLYTHLLEGAGLQPNGPYQAETVLVNSVTAISGSAVAPLTETVVPSATVVDVGRPVTFDLHILGGVGPYQIAWSGLPSNCPRPDLVSLTCVPAAAGFLVVGATVVDSTGAVAPFAQTFVDVNAEPAVTLVANRSATDAGQSISVTAQTSGGTPALTCAWTVNATDSGSPSPCSSPFVLSPPKPTGVTVSVVVTDAAGGSATPANDIYLQFAPTPTILVVPPTNTTPTAGHLVTLSAETSGGSGTLLIDWLLNGSAINGVVGSSYDFVPLAAGNYSLAAEVIDSSGETAMSAAVTLVVSPAPAGHGSSPSSNAASGDAGIPPVAYVAIGVAIGAIFGVALMVLAAPPKRPPPRRRPREAASPTPEE
ncbi:MAG: hypothetical protein L3K05_05065, partial [Thermoplasmata archaeon]|nr:hypothetical protein [Thermoplasmata archaeon]